jgi:hypothetical protein
LPVNIVLPKDKGVKEIDGLPFIKMLNLPNPEDTSLSITTTTGKLLYQVREARWMGVRRIWIEPRVWGGKRDHARGKRLWEEIQSMGFEVVISSGNSILSKGQRGLDAARGVESGKVPEEDGSIESQSRARIDGGSTAEAGVESIAKSKSESYIDSIAESTIESKPDSIDSR